MTWGQLEHNLGNLGGTWGLSAEQTSAPWSAYGHPDLFLGQIQHLQIRVFRIVSTSSNHQPPLWPPAPQKQLKSPQLPLQTDSFRRAEKLSKIRNTSSRTSLKTAKTANNFLSRLLLSKKLKNKLQNFGKLSSSCKAPNFLPAWLCFSKKFDSNNCAPLPVLFDQPRILI